MALLILLLFCSFAFVQPIKEIERVFCDTLKGHDIYKIADLQTNDGCQMNIISPTPSQLCIMDPDDNETALDYTCRNMEDLYEK